jgi:hypothetical protein
LSYLDIAQLQYHYRATKNERNQSANCGLQFAKVVSASRTISVTTARGRSKYADDGSQSRDYSIRVHSWLISRKQKRPAGVSSGAL